jgi:hypothetical protein
MLGTLLQKGQIVLNYRRIEDILQIDELFELTHIRTDLNQLTEEHEMIEREKQQLETVINIQTGIDNVKEETLEAVMSLISGKIQKETSLWYSIVQTAHRLHPKSVHLYENLIDKLEAMNNLPKPTLSTKLPSSDFLDTVKTDNVELFTSQWMAFPSLEGAVPRPRGLERLVQKWVGVNTLRILPLNSVVAFYGQLSV